MTTPSRPRIPARALAGALGLFVALALPTSPPTPAGAQTATSDRSVVEIGTFPRMAPDAIAALGPEFVPAAFHQPIGAQARASSPGNATGGTFIQIPQARQLWQLFPVYSGVKTGFAIRDHDTMKLLKTFVINLRFRRGTTSAELAGDWLHTTHGDKLYLLVENATSVVELDVHTLAQRQLPVPAPLTAGPITTPAGRIAGMTYDPVEQAVILTYAYTEQGYVYLAPVDTRPSPSPAPPRVRRVRSCSGMPPTSTGTSLLYGMPFLVREDALYIACAAPGGGGVAVRLARSGLWQEGSAEQSIVGPVALDTALIDQAGGRISFVTKPGEIWVFDVDDMSFVGVIATGADPGTNTVTYGYGLDPETGRVFFQSATFGVGIADSRFSPVPQARTLRSAKARGQERIIGNPRTGTFLVLKGSQVNKEHEYRVYRAGAAVPPPPPPDPDRNTLDVAEAEGVTERRYLATAGGYGFRTIQSRGFVPVVPAPNVGPQSPTAQVLARNLSSKCGFTDRDFSMGRVLRAEYDHGASSARAAAYEVDGNTKLDIGNPSRCDVTVRDSSGTERFSGIFNTAPQLTALNDRAPDWSMQGAACTSSAGDTKATSAEGTGESPGGKSTATCPLPGHEMTAFAEGTAQGPISVGKAFTDVNIHRLPEGGVLSVVVSAAQDIRIGEIHIGEVRSEATSTSNGRPAKSAMSTHNVRVRNVTVGSEALCAQANACNINAVLTALNAVVAGQAEFRYASGLDERLLQGTPKGASTAVQKSPARQASDLGLVGDATSEVPGLELVVYNDNTNYGRARQVYQFAGVGSAATYNIVAAPPRFADTPITGITPDFGDDELPPEVIVEEIPVTIPGGDTATPVEPIGRVVGPTGPFEKIIDQVVRGIQLILNNPRLVWLFFTTWAVLGLPALLARRRRLLAAARLT